MRLSTFSIFIIFLSAAILTNAAEENLDSSLDIRLVTLSLCRDQWHDDENCQQRTPDQANVPSHRLLLQEELAGIRAVDRHMARRTFLVQELRRTVPARRDTSGVAPVAEVHLSVLN